MKQYVIGIDVGTTIIKAALFDMNGKELYVVAGETNVMEPKFGWFEQDPVAEWGITQNVLKELVEKSGVQKEEIKGIGLSGKMSFYYIGEDKLPTRNAVVWMDNRMADVHDEWARNGTLAEIFKKTGNWLMVSDVVMATRWIQENEPEIMEKTAHICSAANWVCVNLTGEFGANGGDLYSLVDEKRQYSDDVLKIAGIYGQKDKLVSLQDPWEVAGKVTKKAAEETGLAEGTPVVHCGWDVVCTSAGVGAIKSGQANIILGTSGVIMNNLSEQDKTSMLGGQVISNMPGMWQQMIAPICGWNPNANWYMDNFSFEDKTRAEKEGRSVFDVFTEELSKVPPGSNGVIYSPYLFATGERAPFANTEARGNFFGLNLHSSRYVMLRACYEGIAFSNKHCIEVYENPVTEIFLSGGATRSELVCQMFADVCDAIIRLPGGTEFGAKGAAWNAAAAVGLFGSQEEACKAFTQVERTYEPIKENVKIYKEIFEIYKMLPDVLAGPWSARAKFLKDNNFEG